MRQIKARLANRAPLDLSTLDERALMGCIDHSLLRPELTRAEVEAGVDVAIEWETATVCCRPADLPLVVSRLRRTVVGPTTVIGFPHGAHMPNIKEREALVARRPGRRRAGRGAQHRRATIRRSRVRARRAGRARLRGRPDAGEGDPRDGVPHARAGRGRLSRGRRGSGRVRQERHGLLAAGRRGGRDRAHAPRRRRPRRGQGGRAASGRWTRCWRCSRPARAASGRPPRPRSERSGGLAAPRRSGPFCAAASGRERSPPRRPRAARSTPAPAPRIAPPPMRPRSGASRLLYFGLPGDRGTPGCQCQSPRSARCRRKACRSPRETNHHLRAPRSRGGSYGGAVYPGPRPLGRGPFGFPGFAQ